MPANSTPVRERVPLPQESALSDESSGPFQALPQEPVSERALELR